MSKIGSGGPELRGSNITLEKIMAKTDTKSRQTKIICTLGPACWDVPKLEELIEEGLSVARFNFSHGDHEGHKECLDRLRQAAANKGKHIGRFSFCESFYFVIAISCFPYLIISFVYWFSCSFGYQGTRNSLWILCRWRQED